MQYVAVISKKRSVSPLTRPTADQPLGILNLKPEHDQPAKVPKESRNLGRHNKGVTRRAQHIACSSMGHRIAKSFDILWPGLRCRAGD